MPYLGNRPDNVVIRNAQQEFNYTATSSQTTFTGVDTNNNTLAYNPGNVEVFFNGARLEEADFTATNGTSVVLASASATNDLISIVSTDVFEVTDTVSKANGGTFGGDVTVSGLLTADNISTSGYIRGPSSLTIDPATHGDNTGTVVIAGDLTVNGTTTQVNSNTVNIGDNILVLNSDEAGTPSQNSGIEIERGTSTNVAFRWNETTDKWQFTNDGSSYIDLGESDLVGDTTPQLGGNLASNGNDILMADNDKVILGTGSDLQIYHDGSDSYIDDAGTGRLWVRTNELRVQKYTGEAIIKGVADGAVELYHDNVLKLATTATGIDVTGITTSTGFSGKIHPVNGTTTNYLSLKDSNELNFYNSSNVSQTLHINYDGGDIDLAGSAVVIDHSSGNVGIGTSGPVSSGYDTGSTKLTVMSTTVNNATSGYLELASRANSNGYNAGAIQFNNFENAGTAGSGVQNRTVGQIRTVIATTDSNAGDDSGGTMEFYTKPEAGNLARTMVIHSSGNVGIGIDSPGTSIHMKDAITNPNTISTNITIPASSNSMMAGPITLNATLTIPSGSSWTIV